MRITDIQCHLMSCPMPQPFTMKYYGGTRTITKRDAALIRLTTDRELVAYGPAQASEQAAGLINRPIRDALLGTDPADVGALRRKVLAARPDCALTFGAMEIALYDLLGKMEGAPIHQLLGGKKRGRIRLYGSAGMYQPPEEYAREATAVAALGFSAYKMRPALGPEDDLRTVQLMRAALGPDVGICVDAHAWWRMGERSYSAATIEQLARDMAPYRITWLEEPLPPEDRAAYARLREAGIVPIAAGEHETSLDGFREIIEGGAVDIAQADVPHHGGFTVVDQVIRTCAAHGRQFAFHNWGTLLECLADAHLGVCHDADVCSWLEYPCYAHRGQEIMYPFPLADEILAEPLQIEDGELVVPEAPGLGVAVDESVVERYPYIPGPWSTFQLHGSSQVYAMSGDHVVTWEEL